MIQAAWDIGTQWILDLCNGIVNEDWKSSVVLPVYNGKGDPMEFGSYRGIKLLEHAMKVVERIFEHRIRQHVEIDDMQFGFMKSKGTTDAIFTARCYASTVLAVVMRLSVRLSVSLFVFLSQASIVSKRLQIGSGKQSRTISRGL